MHLRLLIAANARVSANPITRFSRARIRSYASTHESDPRNSSPLPDPPTDSRPRWMFSTAAFLRITLVPVGLVYAVFFHDFGEEEHVFMPPRRWLQRQKESLLSLSPAEKKLVKNDEVDDGKRT